MTARMIPGRAESKLGLGRSGLRIRCYAYSCGLSRPNRYSETVIRCRECLPEITIIFLVKELREALSIYVVISFVNSELPIISYLWGKGSKLSRCQPIIQNGIGEYYLR